MNFLNTLTRNYFALILVMLCATSSAFCNADNHLPKENGVYDYDAQRDYEKIREIALEHMEKLASDYKKNSADDRARFLEVEIDHLLHPQNNLFNKVYLLDGKPVGYINYYIHNPWHRSLLPYEVGPNAVINHLAIDSKYQGSGYGTKLLKHALKDFSEKNINQVTLSTTSHGGELEKYYKKFGFDVARESKYTGVQLLAQRLQPHPIVVGTLTALSWLRKLKR